MSFGRYENKDKEFGGMMLKEDGIVSVVKGDIAIARSKERTKTWLKEKAETTVSTGDKIFWQEECEFKIDPRK